MEPLSATVTVSSKHQIVIPRLAREALDIKPRHQIVVIVDSFGVRLVSKARSLTSFAGLGKEMWTAAGGGEAYLNKERASWDVYDRKLNRIRRGARAKR